MVSHRHYPSCVSFPFKALAVPLSLHISELEKKLQHSDVDLLDLLNRELSIAFLSCPKHLSVDQRYVSCHSGVHS